MTILLLQGSVMACEYLLINGSKINAQDNEGKSPLHLAVELGELLCLQYLLLV